MLLSKKTSIKVSREYANLIGHMCYGHPSSGMSVITSVSITKKQGWSSILTGTIRKKPIKRICGINSSRPRAPRKSAGCWTRHGSDQTAADLSAGEGKL